ncbi:Ribose operon repressor [Salisediminibacterium beveridgei]|uniref:Ribose operon repressor n=1 Tax=Salisediminibacterium beveridgei TaxID=632773 RepID=A0A1D7QS23_9BACI|nr:Ribose operon repressor [Salisediminibacterium beveridgei]
MIGLLMPDISNPFFPELARAVEDVALTYGYTVVICNTDEDEKKERHYLDALMQKYIDGLILTTNHLSREEYEQLDLPLVALDRIINDTIPTVVSDNKQGAQDATNHLIDSGCKFIVHIRGPRGVYPADQRYEGFKATTEDRSVASLVLEAGFRINEAEDVIYDVLKKYPQVDGVFASSDVMAAGVMKAARRLGVRIPEDLQLIGFDGIPLGEMLVPSLTTVAQPIYEMGAVSARLLIKQIEKKAIGSIDV